MKPIIIINPLLAAALVILAVRVSILGSEKKPEHMDNRTKEEIVLANIRTRTSIRQFTDEPLSRHQLDRLLHAGMAAPSAGNKQPWRFVVVQEKSIKQQIAAAIGTAQPAAKAPALIVVCADLTQTFPGDGRDYWVEDCSAVSENILLAAHAQKLGAVWLGLYPQGQRCTTIKKQLFLPDNIMPLGMIAVGHPAENPTPKDKWQPEFVHYNVW